jgi:polysaccharide deacetylase 2 family uncharacterized protein YibQ
VAERAAALLLLLAVAAAPVGAAPAISIIIDDLGDRAGDAAVLALPPAVALSVLPHTPYGAHLARAGTTRGHEVLLHLPMEPAGSQAPGPGVLTADLDRAAFLARLWGDLATVPGARGVNNHMGSRLTRQPEQMRWVMTCFLSTAAPPTRRSPSRSPATSVCAAPSVTASSTTWSSVAPSAPSCSVWSRRRG